MIREFPLNILKSDILLLTLAEAIHFNPVFVKSGTQLGETLADSSGCGQISVIARFPSSSSRQVSLRIPGHSLL